MAISTDENKLDKKDGIRHFLMIDGSSLLFRAFYAIRNLTTKDGIYTNGVYGFLTMYIKAVEMIQPDYLVVAFDRSGPSFRTKDYEAYKGTRQKTPEELSTQFGILKDVLDALRIRHIDLDGYEADDIIGTLAKMSESEKVENFLLTGDRDYFQLVDHNTKVLFTKKGISELEIVDEDYIQEKYGLIPQQLIEVKGLQGDASDNIPGVPGVGEKTALKLIKEHGSIENLYDQIDRVTGKKLKENLEENRAQAFLSKQLGTIFREVPLDEEIEAGLEDFLVREPDLDMLRDRFSRLEFDRLADRFQIPKEDQPVEEFAGRHVPVDRWGKLVEKLKETNSFSFLVLGDQDHYIHAQPVFLAIKGKGMEPSLVDIRENAEEFGRLFGPLFNEEGFLKRGYDIKAAILLLSKLGIEVDDHYRDLMLMEYLVDPSRSRYEVAELGRWKLDLTLQTEEEFLGKGAKRKSYPEVELDGLLTYVSGMLQVLEKAEGPLTDQLEELEMTDLFDKIENPLAKVLAHMEETGICVDDRVLDKLEEDFTGRLEQIEQDIYRMAGQTFNINSPKQLGQVLFEDLKLPHGKKTKTGYSTAADVLEALKNDHPIISSILEYRQMAKLVSTYVEGLRPYIDEDSRIRSIFRQNVAATGRLSSTEPNLQNIPIRTEEGRRLREVFTAGEGKVLIDADYSQVELRILASLSGDENMIRSFKEGVDIHAKTAAEVAHKEVSEVTPLERSHAKAVNFGIIYGISDYGLSQDLGISRKEAKEYIDGYMATYPRIKDYMDNIVERAKAQGYVDTYYGRRRNIPELASKNFNIRNFGERIALNTPIQGTAADIIKIAMIRVDRALREKGYAAKLVLQVHDELLVEAPEEEAEEVGRLLIDIMQKVGEFEVDLVADMSIGKNWFEAK